MRAAAKLHGVPIHVERCVRGHLSEQEISDLVVVDGLAQDLARYLEQHGTAIEEAHVHGAQSSAIQSIVSELLRDKLGFKEEVLLTADMGVVTRARPDFYYPIRPGRGVLAEVERGGAVNNNHDIKDFWKAHVSTDAQHLFLIVPNSNWSQDGSPREKPFRRVCRRLAPFFGDPRREVDVVSLHVFGYGAEGDR